MVPMRSVPHRVVCLVGLDDGVFPRLGVVDGDDVLARDPMTGERDIRSEDRQLLLDAIGAATEKLVITYTGANRYSGQPRPPAVPLDELLDTLDMTTTEKIRQRIVVEHPLQPFDIRNVEPGKLVPDVPFSFDPTALRAARASCRPPQRTPEVHLRTAAASTRRRRHPGRLDRLLQRPGEGLLPSVGIHVAARRRRVSKTPCRSTSTPSRSGRSATGCSATSCAA